MCFCTLIKEPATEEGIHASEAKVAEIFIEEDATEEGDEEEEDELEKRAEEFIEMMNRVWKAEMETLRA
ncbi:uncharacterized protein A4U43_C10F1290 [Asparagus officinalis]|uniref:Uncharacterized protein n=1 Tax=Asparagus officinalis TaxID=4686 RepID=A0A5P1E017_ASPOF|nr:uncharacterized protein A4U43_C10F1290 [Asparagus officinalis]